MVLRVDAVFSDVQVGDRVLARTLHWNDCRVHAVSADDTLVVRPCREEHTCQTGAWFGLTGAEVLLDHRAAWKRVFRRHAPAGVLTAEVLSQLFPELTPLQVREAIATVQAERGLVTPVENFDEWLSYCIARHIGSSAYGLGAHRSPPPSFATRRASWTRGELPIEQTPWHRSYENRVRLGGRCPSECAPIDWEAARRTLGIEGRPFGDRERAEVDAVERTARIRLPERIRDFLRISGVRAALAAAHPAKPHLLDASRWTIGRGGRDAGHQGTYSMALMETGSGTHLWGLTWDPGDTDARVEVRTTEGLLPVAPSLAFFLWDVASTGHAWASHQRACPTENGTR